MWFPLLSRAQELPQSENNFIVQHPRTSRFYMLLKIHKPGNPGRPIVSAGQCPTELLASYLDKDTAPFVRGLDSYVKDSGHMLTILDSFLFRGEPHRLVFTMDIKSLSFQTTRDSAPLKYISSTNGRSWIPQHTHYYTQLLRL